MEHELSRRRFWTHVAGATLAIMLGCWLSSGTMAPYGTQKYRECEYRVNGDHGHMKAPYYMLDGAPREDWEFSVVLRRILHPLMAFPLMKWLGFDLGGLVFNMVIHAAAMIVLALALRRFFNARAAILVCWLFASYPGYGYWAGLPYSYAWIVPASIGCMTLLLWWNDRPSLIRSGIAAFGIGFAALGYDLMPCFGGALIFLIVWKRRWLDLPVVLVTLAGFAMFIARGLPAIFDFPVSNSNNEVYGTILGTWLHFYERLDGWGSLLVRLPRIFASNFLFSGLVFFPLLLLWLIALRRRWQIRPVLGPVAICVLLSTFALFLFLNAAPPYPGFWQMRGSWLSRLYQPWFVVVLLVVASTAVALQSDPRRYKLFFWSVIAAIGLNTLTIAGPFARVDFAYRAVYENFYQDWSLAKNHVFFKYLGRRPYGICK